MGITKGPEPMIQLRNQGIILGEDSEKMSKSRGTFIKAAQYLEHLPPEFLRYYYASKLTAAVDDLDINFADFVFKVNSDVVGKVVNIASRVGKIGNNKLNNQLSVPEAQGKKILESIRQIIPQVATYYENLEYARA